MIDEPLLSRATNTAIDYNQLHLTKNKNSKTINCKPLLKWPGGKTSELSKIIPKIPKHKRYFEPFFGGGSVFFNIVKSENPSYINDSHPELMLFYELVKNHDVKFFLLLDNFIRLWNSDNNDRQSIYLDIRKRFNNTKKTSIQKAVDFFILREYAYGGMFRLNSNGGFNVPFGHNYINKDIQKKIDYLNSSFVLDKLKKTQIYNMDFQKFSNQFTFSKSDFMFVDPPYNCSFSKYDKNDFDVSDQERLAKFLLKFKGRFMLVTQYTDLIKDIYNPKKLNINIYDKKYKFNIKGRFNRSVKHALITNYD